MQSIQPCSVKRLLAMRKCWWSVFDNAVHDPVQWQGSVHLWMVEMWTPGWWWSSNQPCEGFASTSLWEDVKLSIVLLEVHSYQSTLTETPVWRLWHWHIRAWQNAANVLMLGIFFVPSHPFPMLNSYLLRFPHAHMLVSLTWDGWRRHEHRRQWRRTMGC